MHRFGKQASRYAPVIGTNAGPDDPLMFVSDVPREAEPGTKFRETGIEIRIIDPGQFQPTRIDRNVTIGKDFVVHPETYHQLSSKNSNSVLDVGRELHLREICFGGTGDILDE